eukprot:2190806-Prymnesium_polylepis.1
MTLGFFSGDDREKTRPCMRVCAASAHLRSAVNARARAQAWRMEWASAGEANLAHHPVPIQRRHCPTSTADAVCT